VAHVRDREGAYRVLVGRPEERRPLGRPRHRWEDNIKLDLQQVGLGGTTSGIGRHGLVWLGSG
jgi:hypothetical protein